MVLWLRDYNPRIDVCSAPEICGHQRGWEIQSRDRREIRLHSNGPLAETDSCTRVTDYSYKS